MITPAPVPKQPEISSSQWLNSVTPCPQWVGYPTRLSLPIDLDWSGDTAVPEIGSRVHIYMNGFGPAEVKAYFHADGYLGVICQPDQMPDWYQKQAPGVSLAHFFGRELEPRRPMPAAAPLVMTTAVVPHDAFGHLLNQSSVPHDVNGNSPCLNQADEWIPDYPDDNQDSTDYQEYPEDEQGEKARNTAPNESSR
jgi:hypothetical protein